VDLRFVGQLLKGLTRLGGANNYTNDYVIGSLFEMDRADKPALDPAEGHGAGYNKKRLSLVGESGKIVEAMTYYATTIDEALKHYSWYLWHVIVGASESNCPSNYVRRIEATETIEDKNQQRDAKESAIHG
jgi:gamma-glutamylcyclotransferase